MLCLTQSFFYSHPGMVIFEVKKTKSFTSYQNAIYLLRRAVKIAILNSGTSGIRSVSHLKHLHCLLIH